MYMKYVRTAEIKSNEEWSSQYTIVEQWLQMQQWMNEALFNLGFDEVA